MDNDAIPFHSHSPPPFDEQQASSDDDFGDFSEFNQSELSACAVNLSIPEHNLSDSRDDDNGGSNAQLKHHLENNVESQFNDDNDDDYVREDNMVAEKTSPVLVNNVETTPVLVADVEVTPELEVDVETTPVLVFGLKLTPHPMADVETPPRLSPSDDETTPRSVDDVEITPQPPIDVETTPQLAIDVETTPQAVDDMETAPQAVNDVDTTPQPAINLETTLQAADVEVTPQLAIDVETTHQSVSGAEMSPELVFDVEITPQSVVNAETTPEPPVDFEATAEPTFDFNATSESTVDVAASSSPVIDTEEAAVPIFAVHFATTVELPFDVEPTSQDDAQSDKELPSPPAAASLHDSDDDQEWASFAPPPMQTTAQEDDEEGAGAWAEWGAPASAEAGVEPEDDDWPEEEDWAAPMQQPTAPAAPLPRSVPTQPHTTPASAPSQQFSSTGMSAFFPVPANAESSDRSCVDLESCVLWEQINSEEALNALAVDWVKTTCFRLLLKALAIDEKAVMPSQPTSTGILQPMIIPQVAKHATTDEQARPLPSPSPPLPPLQQPAANAGSGEMTFKERSGSDLAQLSFHESRIEFDWINSGLTNPLDGPQGSNFNLDFFTVDSNMVPGSPIDDPLLRELELAAMPAPAASVQQQQQQQRVQSSPFNVDAILAQIGKRATMTSPLSSHESCGGGVGGGELVKEEELCEESRHILEQLPDLSFLLSAVLMFPVRQRKETTE